MEKTQEKKIDIVGAIIDYETGMLSEKESVKLFAELIKTGQCWQLQGHYGRTASALINGKVIDKQGNILIDLE